jgi:hypothetical protein
MIQYSPCQSAAGAAGSRCLWAEALRQPGYAERDCTALAIVKTLKTREVWMSGAEARFGFTAQTGI